MAIQFPPDVVSAGPKLDTFTRKAKAPRNDSPAEKAHPAVIVQFARTEVYEPHGKSQLPTVDSGTLLDAYLETKNLIRQQLAHFFGFQVNEAPALAKDEATVLKEIPEYWNKENTARRIFSIALLGYQEGGDREEFADRAIAMVMQAYRDVGSTLGFEFPDLVMDTRQAVLDALEQFRGGAALSEISFG